MALKQITTMRGISPFLSISSQASHIQKLSTSSKVDGKINQSSGSHYDLCIVGGGVMGSSIAYWIKQRLRENFKIAVIERDPTYTKASTVLSLGGVRQQFSLKENIEMGMFGAEFLQRVPQILGVENSSPPDVQFHKTGYLCLASEASALILEENFELQKKCGAKSVLLTQKKLKEKFPWLNVENVELACHGLDHEGWFDPWALLQAFKQKAVSLGVDYLQAEVTGFGFSEAQAGTGPYEKKLDRVVAKTSTGEEKIIKFDQCVISGGYESGKIAALANIGCGTGDLSVALPVEPRKRYVFCVHAPDGPGLDCPLLIDYTGAYFRRDGTGGRYFCGQSPLESEEPNTENLEVDYSYFDNNVWPILAHRAPFLENIKVKSAWAGYYDYNTFDQNAIIGAHPSYSNLYFATGFSGHGIQQAPATGRAVMELILDGHFKTIDLTRFQFERLIRGEEVKETNII